MDKHIRHYRNLSRSPIYNHFQASLTRSGFAPGPGQFKRIETYRPDNWVAWLWSYLKNTFGPNHRFLGADEAPNDCASVYTGLPDKLNISLAGDWATGTEESYLVAECMKKWSDGTEPDLMLHLGDVYFVGDELELRDNCLNGRGSPTPDEDCVEWPIGKLGSFALNGNHEMLARGIAYFKTFLPALGMRGSNGIPQGQGPSFFCLENTHWRIVGLDTGYNSVGVPILSMLPCFTPECELPPALLDWLHEQDFSSRPKATVLLSHHQWFTAFDGESNFPRPAQQLKEFFGGTPLLWIWGHEHRFAGYKFHKGDLQVHGRCIGHGGMPIEAADPSTDDERQACVERLRFYDRRANPVLEPEDGEELEEGEVPLGFNGHINLKFDGDTLTIDYLTLAAASNAAGEWGYNGGCDLLMTEVLRRNGGAVEAVSLSKVTSDRDMVLIPLFPPAVP